MHRPSLIPELREAPHGHQYDTTYWPVLGVIRYARPDDEAFEEHLRRMEAIFRRGEPIVLVVEPQCKETADRQRIRRLIQWQRDLESDQCVGFASVIHSPLQRVTFGFMRAMLRGSGVPSRTFATFEEAVPWGLALIEQAKQRRAA